MHEISDQKSYLYVTTPLDEDSDNRAFVLENVQGHEQISTLFHYHLQLKAANKTINTNDMIGKTVTVHIHMSNDQTRYINGVVTSFVQSEFTGNLTSYQAEIRPYFWLLTLTQNCKIFQEQTVPEIITTVLNEYDFIHLKNNLNNDYVVRDYCVQYQESSYNFITRLMEDEGIYYYFKHTQDQHELLLMDSIDSHDLCSGADTVQVASNSFDVTNDCLIRSCNFTHQMIPNQYTLKCNDYRNPELPLEETINAKTSGDLNIFSFEAERAQESKDVKQAALSRMEAFEVNEKILTGESFCRGFSAGYKFSITNHHRSDMNKEYVINQLSIHANQSQYLNTFSAFPADIPFRCQLTAVKPKVYGTQTATVVGESDSEIFTDEMGRVKVQFHWDREGKNDENCSCWIRVAQMWAGNGWGSLFIPRIGHEVLVDFIQGNPDIPVIIGSLYNGNNHPPYDLPNNKTISAIKSDSSKGSGGYNEISFDDKKDNEIFRIHSQKDTDITTLNNKSENVGNDDTYYVKNNRTKSVDGEETESIGKDKYITIGKDNFITIEKNLDESIKEDMDLSIGKNASVSIGGDYSIDITKNCFVNIEKQTNVEIKKELEINASNMISINGNKELVIKIGSAKITVKKDGTVIFQCKDFKIKSSGDISMKANNIKAN